MRIHQLLIGAGPGDAVTESARSIQRALARSVESRVYAVHVHPDLADEIGELADFPRDGTADDVLVFHVSIGEPGLVDFLRRSPERIVLCYHNITPARFFDELDPDFASKLRDGRWELRPLTTMAVGAVAASHFNAAELAELGMGNVAVAAPPLHLDRLQHISTDCPIAEELAAIDDPVIAMIGQMHPHKRPDLAVDTHHLLNVNHIPRARLWMAGPFRNERYAGAVQRHIDSLRLDTVRVLGHVSDTQLAALYRRADLLLLPSEHEGFGVPLIEAFGFGVPVVTRAYGAIPETADGAALILPPDATAADLCEAVARVLGDPAVTAELVARGRDRAAQFSAEATLANWLGALAGVLRNGTPARP